MTHKGTVTLETERLILRRFSPDDADAMFRNWASDPEVTKFLMWSAHTDVNESRRIATLWSEQYSSLNIYQWAIVPKSVGEPIGSISVVHGDDKAKSVHIGYCIGKAWWGNGYTPEALTRLVRFFFEEVGVNRIESRHDPRNPNSGKVMQKAGMRYEGVLRQSDWNNQGICDAAYYAILAEDYFTPKTQDKPAGYIQQIRAKIGHDPIIMTGSAVFVYRVGKILLQRRADNGNWSKPGGAMELGESLEDTARRELFEESGLTANSLELLGMTSGAEETHVYPNGDKVFNVTAHYLCTDFTGEPCENDNETTQTVWFDVDNLPEPVSETFRRHYENLFLPRVKNL
jgi:ribosomal-protein-alanine N-acetyltransferase